jgi:hypothetical protein
LLKGLTFFEVANIKDYSEIKHKIFLYFENGAFDPKKNMQATVPD